MLGTSVTAFAANDPIQVVNNLSDFIFGLVRAVLTEEDLAVLKQGCVDYIGFSYYMSFCTKAEPDNPEYDYRGEKRCV